MQVTRPIFGSIPRRYLGIIVFSFLTATLAATLAVTLWGRLVEW